MPYLLQDKLRCLQLDSLSIDEEVEELAYNQITEVLNYFGSSQKLRDVLKITFKGLLRLMAVVKSPNKTIGMSMMQMRLQGSNMKGYLYSIFRSLEHCFSELDPLSRKVLDIFNTACFLVFIYTGRYYCIDH